MIDMIITDMIVVIDMTAENVMIDMIEIEITMITMKVDTEVAAAAVEEVVVAATTENADHHHTTKTDHVMIDHVHVLILHVRKEFKKFSLKTRDNIVM